MGRIVKKNLIPLSSIFLIAIVLFILPFIFNGCQNPLQDVAKGMVFSEINIKYETEDILSGSEYDFGNVPIESTKSANFTIENLGTADLILFGDSPFIEITGKNASEFSVETSPKSPIAPGSSTTFTIKFNPSNGGSKTATIIIKNYDADENPYEINISGQCTTIAEPEINVKQGTTNIPSSSGSYDFGIITVGSFSSPVTFTIENTGSADLILTDSPMVSKTGTDASMFNITQPTSPVGVGGNTTFTITFNPTSSGTKAATVTIPNNDSNENPYTFTIIGNETGPPVPEINVKQGTTDIPTSSGSYGFESVILGSSSSLVTFTIENTGSADLFLSGSPMVSKTGTDASMFNITQPTSPVGAGSNTTFNIIFTPTSTGTKTATVTILNNDSNESTYTFTISGECISDPVPEINVKQGTTNIPSSSGSYDFGSIKVPFSSSQVTFTIENTGSADLILNGSPEKVSKTGTDASMFNITQPSSPVGVGSSTTFTIIFTPTSTGTKTATVTILNNDSNESTYTFTIIGNGIVEGTVASPTFNPIEGIYPSAQNVAISTSTALADIRYTTDGISTPSSTYGTLYGGTPVPVNSTTTIKAIAYKDGWADSAVESATYTILNPPANVQATDGTYTNKVRITWNSVSGATRYYVYRSTSSSGTYSSLGYVTGLYKDDTSVTPGTTYYYKVKAYNNGRYSAYSAYNSGWRGLIPPTVSATDGTYTNKVRITWNSVSGATRYYVYRSTSSSGTYSSLGYVTGLYKDDTSVTPGTTYYYKVKAYNNGRYSAYSAYNSGWRGLIPPTVSATDGTYTNKVRITWNSVSGATRYYVYRSTSSSGTYSSLGYVTGLYKNDYPDAATKYYYKVKAYNNGRYSAYSDYDRGFYPYYVSLKSSTADLGGMSINYSTASTGYDTDNTSPPHWRITSTGGYIQFNFSGQRRFDYHASGSPSDLWKCYVDIYVNNNLFVSDVFIGKDWIWYGISSSYFGTGSNSVKIVSTLGPWQLFSGDFWIDLVYAR